MNLLDLFRFQGIGKKSATVAKERLKIILSHQSPDGEAPEFLPRLRQDILTVIQKYAPIDPAEMTVQLQTEGNCSILELNIALPSEALKRCHSEACQSVL
ncbi:MAG: cell division topological specificity factor MinE [Pseudomonadota bacterium]|jgi:cell division topological specificity factor